MNPSDVWCEKHWEVVKDDSVTATLLLAANVIEEPRFVDACGGVAVAACSVETISRAMVQLSPLCCVLGDERVGMLVAGLKGSDVLAVNLIRGLMGAP